MNTNVWLESGGELLRESLRQEAGRWHLLHQHPTTLGDWQDHRKHIRSKMHAVAGTFPDPVPLALEEHGTLELDGYRIIKLTYQSRPNLRVTANLYVPDGDGPFPGVLGVHGHWPQGKIAARVAARGHTLAREGFVVLIVDALGSGERGTTPGEFEYHGMQLGCSLLSVGETLLGMQVYDNMRGIDLLQSLDYVDGDRIGVTGASGGGNQTMWVAAFDERVKAAAPVVSVGTFESYVTNNNCVCETLPFGLTFMEEWAVLAQTAPNALLILNALQDGNPAFDVHQMVRSFNAAREVYRLLGCEEKIAYKAIDLPHGYWPEMRSHMLGWFKRWLKDEGDGWPCAIPDIPELPESDLLCFPGGTRPGAIGSILQHVAEKSDGLKRRLLDDAAPLDRRAKAGELRQLLRAAPVPENARRLSPVRGSEEGREFEKFSVASAAGILIPCVHLMSGRADAGRIAIAVHKDGKDALAQKECVRAALDRGTDVCLVDLRNIGETRWDCANPKTAHTDSSASRSSLWLGRTMIGEWVTDLLAVRDALARDLPDAEFEIMAFGEPALAALAAAALSSGFEKVTVSGLPHTYVVTDTAPVQSMGIFVPGMLHWGDVSLMAALAACRLSVHEPVTPAGTPLKGAALSDWREEILGLARRAGTEVELEIG